MASIERDYRGMTRQELYGLAQERDIEGRSRLSKDALVEALELDDVGPDAVTLLLEQHDDIRELFARFDELSPRPSKKKQKLVHDLVTHLMRHVQLEEEAFYPAVRDALAGSDRDVDEALEEHHVAELLLSELEVMVPAEERYDAKVRVLTAHMVRHFDEEEQQLFVWVQDDMEAYARRELGAAMTAAWGEIEARPRWHVVPEASEDEVFDADRADVAPVTGSAEASQSLERANAALPAPEPVADDSADAAGDRGVDGDAMTRSEEELVVGTTRETGTARVRKQVVTEHVSESVPVERETAVVQREPIGVDERDAAAEEPVLSEDEREVLLYEEEAVAEKRTVPKERVHLGKRTRTDQEVVEGEVAREDIEVVMDDRQDDADDAEEDELIDLAGLEDPARP